eukprot:Rhum_TRINITY_DN14827_c21_g1::Rhum_TRINITY_DN14827_c21_g1_i1::g.122156::m.122156
MLLRPRPGRDRRGNRSLLGPRQALDPLGRLRPLPHLELECVDRRPQRRDLHVARYVAVRRRLRLGLDLRPARRRGQGRVRRVLHVRRAHQRPAPPRVLLLLALQQRARCRRPLRVVGLQQPLQLHILLVRLPHLHLELPRRLLRVQVSDLLLHPQPLPLHAQLVLRLHLLQLLRVHLRTPQRRDLLLQRLAHTLLLLQHRLQRRLLLRRHGLLIRRRRRRTTRLRRGRSGSAATSPVGLRVADGGDARLKLADHSQLLLLRHPLSGEQPLAFLLPRQRRKRMLLVLLGVAASSGSFRRRRHHSFFLLLLFLCCLRLSFLL